MVLILVASISIDCRKVLLFTNSAALVALLVFCSLSFFSVELPVASPLITTITGRSRSNSLMTIQPLNMFAADVNRGYADGHATKAWHPLKKLSAVTKLGNALFPIVRSEAALNMVVPTTTFVKSKFGRSITAEFWNIDVAVTHRLVSKKGTLVNAEAFAKRLSKVTLPVVTKPAIDVRLRIPLNVAQNVYEEGALTFSAVFTRIQLENV